VATCYDSGMSQKSVWLTWMPLGAEAPQPQATVQALGQAGLAVTGSPWVDAPRDFAWSELGSHLAGDNTPDVWVIAARRQDLANTEHRFGLAMALAMVRADAKKQPHVVQLGLDGLPQAADLPTLLRSAVLVDGSVAGHATKVLLATLQPAKAPAEPFRLRVIAHKMLGLWVEVGPAQGVWKGAMVGVAGGATIQNHAVGKRGGLPERTVLHHKLEGLQLEVAGAEFVANAVQNELTTEDSYYLKLDGRLSHLLIGQHPDGDPEVSVLQF
jgi:hypothetical protein